MFLQGLSLPFYTGARDRYGEPVYFLSASNNFKSVLASYSHGFGIFFQNLELFLKSQTSALFDQSIKVPLLLAGLLINM